MTKLNSPIWKIIAETQEQETISLAHVEKTLGHSLTENTEQSNEFFKFYTAEPMQLAGNVAIHKIHLRLPRSASNGKGALAIYLQGECITLPKVRQQFPVLEITGTPRGDSLEEATTFTTNTAWGRISFGFQEKKPDCVGYVGLQAK